MHDWNVLYGLFEGSLSLMTQDVCRSERLKNCDLFNDSLNYRINPFVFKGVLRTNSKVTSTKEKPLP